MEDVFVVVNGGMKTLSSVYIKHIASRVSLRERAFAPPPLEFEEKNVKAFRHVYIVQV